MLDQRHLCMLATTTISENTQFAKFAKYNSTPKFVDLQYVVVLSIIMPWKPSVSGFDGVADRTLRNMLTLGYFTLHAIHKLKALYLSPLQQHCVSLNVPKVRFHTK